MKEKHLNTTLQVIMSPLLNLQFGIRFNMNTKQGIRQAAQKITTLPYVLYAPSAGVFMDASTGMRISHHLAMFGNALIGMTRSSNVRTRQPLKRSC